MKYIGKLLGGILLGINAIVALLLFLSAYSPSIDPHAHPVISSMGLFFPVFLLVNVFFLIFWAIVYRRFILFPLLVFILCWGSIRTYFPINGWGEDAPEEAIKIVSYNTKPLVLDADALTLLSMNKAMMKLLERGNRRHSYDIVLTPHMGEFARLLHTKVANLQDNFLDIVRAFVDKYDVVGKTQRKCFAQSQYGF